MTLNKIPAFAAKEPAAGLRSTAATESGRLDYLDATRAFALVLGVIFHASLSFMPVFMGWAVMDVSTSAWGLAFITVSHSFRMQTFFMLAGFFAHAAFHRKGAGDFVRARLLRLGVPFIMGWFILSPLIVSGWIMGGASMRGDYSFWAGIRAGFQSLSNLPSGLFIHSHLWFIYYLAIITALALIVRGLLTLTRSWYERIARRADAVVAWMANSSLCLPILVIPTAAVLWFMHGWGMDTPDQTLWPEIPVVILYGSFFSLGWMLNRQRDLIARFTRLSLHRWILAAIGMTGAVVLNRIELDQGHPRRLAAHLGFAVSYALMMWSLVFLVIGLFKKLFHRPHPFIRYMADSSYWMYLIHLPLVVWLQVSVAEVPVHWSFKLTFISASTIAIALLSYDLFVRSTFIGWVLNGSRRRRVMPQMMLGAVRRLRLGKQLIHSSKLAGSERAGGSVPQSGDLFDAQFGSGGRGTSRGV